MTEKPANSDLTAAERVAARIVTVAFLILAAVAFLYFFQAGLQTLT